MPSIDLRTRGQIAAADETAKKAPARSLSKLFKTNSSISHLMSSTSGSMDFLDRTNTPEMIERAMSINELEKENSIRDQMSSAIYEEAEERMYDTQDGKEMACEFRSWFNAMTRTRPNLKGFSVDAVEVRSATCKIRISSCATNSKRVALCAEQISTMLKDEKIKVVASNPLLINFNNLTDSEFEQYGTVMGDILTGDILPPTQKSATHQFRRADSSQIFTSNYDQGAFRKNVATMR